MSLYKQITTLITVFLVFMIGIILWFILSYNKNLIENQMLSNAKNTATFLGLSISRDVDFEDTSTIEGMLSSIIDNGFYEYISIVDVNNNEVLKMNSPNEEKAIPSWFTSVISINAPVATANIISGWTNMGTLSVKIHQDYANNQMWDTFIAVLQIFTISTLLLLFLIYLFLNKLLKPLKKLNIQAKAIDNNEFIIEKELPNTIEFKNVVQAMNKTISKMETIFNKEVTTLKKYNELLYKDSDTGLGNKNFLILKLNTYLKNSQGLILFLELKDENSFKKIVGYKNFSAFENKIISEVNTNFSQNNGFVFSKLDDNVLAIILPNIYYEDIKDKILDIYTNIYKYVNNEKLDQLFDIRFGIGVSHYSQNSTLKDVLSTADQSLLKAMKSDTIKINYLQESVKFTKQEWIELLEWAFSNDGLQFVKQDIINIGNSSTLMQEYFVRLKDKDENIYYPADFLTIAFNMGWIIELEKHIIKKIFNTVLTTNVNFDSAINLSSEFIKSKDAVKWLISELDNEFFNKNIVFYFECINSDILKDLASYTYFAKQLAKTKHKFAIESFSFESNDLNYLKILKPTYLKISKSYLLGSENSLTDSVLFNITSTLGSYLIVKHIETQEEYLELEGLGIKYLQGRYLDGLIDAK
jgi:EAL domain-containing protein (putative c-di-GMP-specific phosphodiesterase class I)/GGDEF domain-containing protein